VLKKIFVSGVVATLLSTGLMADKCVCFELKGEFGDEVMALMQKYMKNMGDQNITVVREEKVSDKAKQSFVDSLVGIIDPPASSPDGQYDLESGKNFYNKQCSACHGLNGEARAYGTSKPIAGMSEESVYNALKSYQNSVSDDSYGSEAHGGAARFVKQTITQSMTHSLMRNVAAYVQSLSGATPEVKKPKP